MEKISLKAMARETLGKSYSKHLRKDGIIPCVVYKDGGKGLNVQVDSKALWQALHTSAGENAIITMDIGDGKKKAEKTVMIKEIQHHPVNDKFVHVDFQEISLSEKLRVKVQIAVKGEAAGIKEDGGVFNVAMWEVEVECLPTAIPEHIDVHVENLRINEAIHVKELPVLEGISYVDEPDQVVVSVTPPKAEKEEVAPEVAEGVGEPEVIKKGKKEEEGVAEAGEAPASAAKEDKKEEKKEKKA